MWKYVSRASLKGIHRNLNLESFEIKSASKYLIKNRSAITSCRGLLTCVNKENKKLCRGQFLYPKPRQLCEYSDVAQPISVEPVTKESPSYYRTLESDPRNHDEKHLGRIYTIPGMFCVKKFRYSLWFLRTNIY